MIKWFERKFNFQDLEGTLPGILERLEGTPVRLREKIEGIPPDYYKLSADDSWSIQQHVGHLGDLESLWENRFKDFLQGKKILTEADLSNRKTHEANHHGRSIGELIESFGKQRKLLCIILRSLGDKAEQWHSKHPRLLAPMRPIDLAYFVAEHDDHHLASITRLSHHFKSHRS